jgi:Cu/Ag efflux protein CusF
LASKTFGSAIFLTVGGVFLVVGILDLRETQRLRAEGELARGKVIGRHWYPRGRPYSLDVELLTRAGVRVTLAESVGRGRYERTKPGDTVPLHYLPSDPSVMKIGAKPQPDPVGFFMSLSAFIMAGAIYLANKRWPMRSPVERRSPPWTRTQSRLVILILAAAVAGTALPLLLLRNAPTTRRSRHEYLLKGQVLSIALDRKEARITHDAIDGFRPATTMSYSVPDAAELADLQPGEPITATVVVVTGDIHLEDIKKVVVPR